MVDFQKLISAVAEKTDRRKLIRLAAIVAMGAVGLGAMHFLSGKKPVVAVAKVSPAKKSDKTLRRNSPSKKTTDEKTTADGRVESAIADLKSKIEPDTNIVAGSANVIQSDPNSVLAEADPGEAAAQAGEDKAVVTQSSAPSGQENTSLGQADANDNEARTPATSAAVETQHPETVMPEPEASEIQSLTFAPNTQIPDALLLLAVRYQKNIVPSPDVTGTLAFENLYNVTFAEAMEAILGTDFRYEEKGNLVKVFPRDKGAMVYKVFSLYYINAAEARKLVEQVLSTAGKVEVTTAAQTGIPSEETIGPQTGAGDAPAMNDMLIVCDYPENIKMAEQVVASIDIRPKQVMIEATILSASLTEGMQFGIDWQTIKSVAIQSLADLAADTPDYYGSSGSSAKVGSSNLAGGLTIGFVHNDVAGFIRAVEEVTDVTVLANPKILAVNKQLGQIYIGTKIAYQSQTKQTDTSTTEQVEFLDTGTKLSFRPYIGNDGFIRIDIHPKDSSATLRSSGTTTLPDETSAELVTNIMVKDGQTIVIGGLFRDRVSTTKTQIPVMGDLPIIGGLFRGTADEVKREEVIVLLTPHIITDPNQTGGDAGMADIQRRILGTREGLQWINKVRRASEYYDKAAEHYLQGDHTAALKDLDAALRLYPSYVEAIRLKELIIRELSLKRLKATTGR
jgi:type IV pilus assembly protein PilQ